MPAAYLLVLARQQLWPINPYPGSNDDSLYVAHAEIALPLYRRTAGSVWSESSRIQTTACAGDTLSGELRTGPLLVRHVTVGYS